MLLVAGTHSGCGKSTVTLGVLAALREMGISVQPFKSGPDFIDPGLHTSVAGRNSRNLDLWMCGKKYCRESVVRHSAGAGTAVIEGVMGLFDGGERSSAALAAAIGANVVLVVNAYGMAESSAAVIRGFCDHAGAGGGLDGVIFNNVSSDGHYERLRKAAAPYARALGYLPRDAALSIPERHLGLTVAEEAPLDRKKIKSLARAALSHIDMERLLRLARAPKAIEPSSAGRPSPRNAVKIAVARDRAFCFYYEDNFDMLREAGAELIFFSPLKDRSLPDGADAVYLGGGYPEIHARALSANRRMRKAVREWVESGMPLYAECGGFMYLCESVSYGGESHEMCGVFPFRAGMGEGPVLGYRQINIGADCIMGRQGQRLRGHEFHYSRLSEVAGKKGVERNVLGEGLERGISSAFYKNTLATYTHVHFGSNAKAAAHFVKFIREGAGWK